MKKVVLISVVLAFCLHADEVKNLSDMTVTAQKTEENVQDVPISMSVFDEISIEDKQIENLEDLTKSVPNFSFDNQGWSGAGSPSMRGMFGAFHDFNSPVVVLIDGVPILSGAGMNTFINDIERIEVLRGPQGTLYGKNAEVGVINIISKKPTNETEGKVEAKFGNMNRREFNANASGAIIDNKLYIGVSALDTRRDGFIDNVCTGDKAGDKETTYGKIYLRATPIDNLEISFINSFIKYHDKGAQMNALNMPDREVASDFDSFNKALTTLSSLKIAYDFSDDMKLESITSYKKMTDDSQQDWDFANPTYAYYPGFTYHELRDSSDNFSTLSQEFRLSGKYEKFDYLAGLYVDKDEVNFNSKEVTTNYDIIGTIHSKSLGVFTHLGYQWTDSFKIIGGIRYDLDKKEDKEMDIKKDFSSVSPKLALEYQINDNSMVYTSVAKGYRAGGFDYRNPTTSQRAFDQEELISYEAGIKNLFLDGNLMLNFNVFYMDIDDMQVQTPVSFYASYTSNAAKAKSKGVEIEASYKVTNALTFFANFGYNDTKFKDFKENTYDQAGNITGTADYDGNKNIYSPDYNYNIGAVYRNSWGLFARADLSGFGKTYTDKENTNKIPNYEVVDAKIGYEAKSYEIYLYANNLFDKEHNIRGYENSFINYSTPREFGVEFAYRF